MNKATKAAQISCKCRFVQSVQAAQNAQNHPAED
jgi:hypothetical protein